MDMNSYKKLNAKYERSATGGGAWTEKRPTPKEWVVSYGELKFLIKPMGFKHTGLFPEQAGNWEKMSALIKNAGRPISVLNLFCVYGGSNGGVLKSRRVSLSR